MIARQNRRHILLARGSVRFDKAARWLTALSAICTLGACEAESGSDALADASEVATPNEDATLGRPEPSGDAQDADASVAMDASSVAPARDAGPRAAPSDAGRDAQSASPSDASTRADAAGVPTLFFLDIAGGRVMRGDPNAHTSTALVTRGTSSPDGIAVDVQKGVMYWTNMGVPDADDGSLQRADLKGGNVTTIVAKAKTFTPKQLHLEAASDYLYWSDREGMRVMRAHSDGSNVETLVVTGSGDTARADAANWAVGIAVDVAGDKIYWTQKGPDNGHQGSIRRAKLTPDPGQDPARRSDIEILFAGLPEPVDLDLDLNKRFIYWTDRGDDTVSRAPLDPPVGVAPDKRTDRAILVRSAGEVIGIALDVPHDALYVTSLEGTVTKAALDGSGATALLKNQGSLTGIAYVELPR